ncbi:GTP 3',8-cyclase MoaA [Rhodococcus opacus]|uniref:GTP 3',8-cyclase MoaA n=1 Tax=Rhodococcus opacus TaxID=37919 RepID=UPI000EA8CF6D|nr:GTP 3',8-cyclase MoaA [Rhodococcus opacus]QZS52580.1 GTP 3',8-cyclase MoaA [Rhodococcus opacus]RKM65342.1 GTP 3',8-cyclase MoaA [Rhodococcus opacus]
MTTIDLGTPRLSSIAAADPSRPDTPALVDTFGRVATDLRISLTDRCNLRCTYCMPAEGLDWMPSSDLLSDDELLRLIHVAVSRLGIRELRFTGGEPLLRRGLEDLIGACALMEPRPEISLTTNGIGLDRRAAALARAGLDRLNVSLDTLKPDRFKTITRRDRLPDVLAGLAAAKTAGLAPVKVNSVLMRGVNADEAVDMLSFAVKNGYELRFIEQMPLDAQHGWERAEMVTAQEILASLRTAFTLEPDSRNRGAAPAELWIVDGGPRRVGVIGAVTRPFCDQCDRTRLTADGQVRSCLFATTETDLRALLRGGADDGEIADAWRNAMWAKAAGHGINAPDFLQPSRPMSAIGG